MMNRIRSLLGFGEKSQSPAIMKGKFYIRQSPEQLLAL